MEISCQSARVSDFQQNSYPEGKLQSIIIFKSGQVYK